MKISGLKVSYAKKLEVLIKLGASLHLTDSDRESARRASSKPVLVTDAVRDIVNY